jgi:hypothetical protein
MPRTGDVDALAALQLGPSFPERLLVKYVSIVRDIRKHFISNPAFERPAKKFGRGASASANGQASYMKAGQRIKCQNCPFGHRSEACTHRDLPTAAERAQCKIPEDIEQALQFAIGIGPDKLAGWRQQQLIAFTRAEKDLREINEWIAVKCKQQRPAHVRRVTRTAMLATIAFISDSTLSQDVTIARRFLLGFPLEGEIEDSGTHRPIDPIPKGVYLQQCQELSEGAWPALKAIAGSITASARSGDPATAAELCRLTQVQVDLGRLSDGMTLEQLCMRLWGFSTIPTDAEGKPSVTCPLASRRFGIWQNGKLRPIEDCLASGVNIFLYMWETISPPTIDWIAIIAARVWDITRLESKPMPEMTIALDDVAAGYNNCPAATPQIICMWDVTAGRKINGIPVGEARYYLSYVCGFGNAASVISFCRLPELISRFCARLFATASRAYIDDWLQPDFAEAKSSSQDCLARVHKAVGLPLAACAHPACGECHQTPAHRPVDAEMPRCKRRRAAATQEALGVVCSLKNVRKGFADYHPRQARVDRILHDLQTCADSGILTPAVAHHIMGRLTFVTHSSIFGRVARAPTLPFYRRIHGRSLDGKSACNSHAWTREMNTALDFLKALFTEGQLPHRRIIFNDLPPSVAYSDAQGETFGIGLCAFDPLLNNHPGFTCSTSPPDWLLARVRSFTGKDQSLSQKERDQGIINCIELIGAISLLLTFPDVFTGRKAFLFQDNSTAFACMCTGSSTSVILNEIAHIYHLVVAALRLDTWVEWCSTHAMLADMPSRPFGPHKHRAAFAELGLIERSAIFPSEAEWLNPIMFFHTLRRRFDPTQTLTTSS